jgi:glycosidase
VLMNVIDSHDTARFLTLARGDESALRLAWLFMMCYPGAPCIYYGDETGMEGGKDPDCRRAFQWDERRWNTGLLDYLKGCIALRKAHPALRRGEYQRLLAVGDIYVFGRKLGDETLIVVLNAGQDAWDLRVPVDAFLGKGAVLQGVWKEGKATVKDGTLTGLCVARRSGLVLEVVSPKAR